MSKSKLKLLKAMRDDLIKRCNENPDLYHHLCIIAATVAESFQLSPTGKIVSEVQERIRNCIDDEYVIEDYIEKQGIENTGAPVGNAARLGLITTLIAQEEVKCPR